MSGIDFGFKRGVTNITGGDLVSGGGGEGCFVASPLDVTLRTGGHGVSKLAKEIVNR